MRLVRVCLWVGGAMGFVVLLLLLGEGWCEIYCIVGRD